MLETKIDCTNIAWLKQRVALLSKRAYDSEKRNSKKERKRVLRLWDLLRLAILRNERHFVLAKQMGFPQSIEQNGIGFH